MANKNLNYTVYAHINKVNNKIYIGITSKKPKKRWGYNGINYKCQIFYRAIQKYGWDNFEHIILFKNKTKEEAEELEKLYIKVLMGNNCKYGYNVSNGGSSTGKHSDETIKKISQSQIGELNHMYGVKRGLHQCAKKVYYNNLIFNCIQDFADYIGSTYSRINGILNGQILMPIEYYKNNLHLDGKQMSDYIVHDEKMWRKKCSETRKIKKIKPPNSKKVYCEGILFNSIKECADYYNIKRETMNSWLNGKNPMPLKFYNMGLRICDKKIENYIIKENKPKKEKQGKKIICDGIIFKSNKSASSYLNILETSLSYYLRGKVKMPKEFLDRGLRYLNEETKLKTKDNKCKEVICDDLIFNSIKECALYYNVNDSAMRCWLNGTNGMPEEFIEKNLKYLNKSNTKIKRQNKNKKVICDGVIYESITECSCYYNIKLGTMVGWLINKNGMPKKFIDLGLRYLDDDKTIYKENKQTIAVICENKIFETIKKCSKYYGKNAGTISRWLSGKYKMPQQYIDLGLRYATEEDLNTYPLYEETENNIQDNNTI